MGADEEAALKRVGCEEDPIAVTYSGAASLNRTEECIRLSLKPGDQGPLGRGYEGGHCIGE